MHRELNVVINLQTDKICIQILIRLTDKLIHVNQNDLNGYVQNEGT